MFPNAYFALRYFALRFFPRRAGGGVIVPPGPAFHPAGRTFAIAARSRRFVVAVDPRISNVV